MKKHTINPNDTTMLRQKAEDQLKHKQSNKSLSFSEAETLKLIHELEVHQIELEMQNEELSIAKEKAELAEEKYTDIYDFAPSGYLSISKDGKIVELNFAAAHMLGKVRSKLKNRCFAFYLSQETLPVFNLFVQKVFTNKVKQACEVIITNEVNTPIYVNIEGILSQNDELCHLTLSDITERKQAEDDIIKLNESLEQRVLDRTKQLEESNKALEAFSHSISHDLRAPLRSIVGFSQILIEEYQPILGSEGSRLLQIVIDSTKKMNNLIEGLLKISKVNYVKVDKVIIDMNQVIAYVLSNVHNFFDTSKVSFQIDNLQEGLGDATLIGQVWINLIANAVKFSSKHPSPQITIQSYKKDNDIVYLIKDNGTGFKPEFKDKIFTIFNRFHSSDEFEGTGVGLALVHRIIQKHGGTIWVESTEGKGTTFYFSLPLSSP